ncbi:hypothetical protein BX666DRAFT_2113235 [Dichotomocladium elegans]|nr:hypothetical protein BX666DRAFT_2113235 [Dichotomocladium elegans]
MMKSILLMLVIIASCATARPLLLPGTLLGNTGDGVDPVRGNPAPYDSNPYNNPQEQCRIECAHGTRWCQKECPPSLPPTNEVFGPESPQYQIDAIKDSNTPVYNQPTTATNPARKRDDVSSASAPRPPVEHP